MVEVSVIVPCYNSSSTLRATLDSILAQTLRDFEIVAVDDGSTDNTLVILEGYAQRVGDRFRVLQQPNAGPYVARNRAIANAKGRYMAFLDSDDLWHETKLERQTRLMDAGPALGLSYTEAFAIDHDGRHVERIHAYPDYRGRCFAKLLVRNKIVTSSVMVRREVFDRIGLFDEEFFARGDWEMWTRIAFTYALDYLPEPLTLSRSHPGNMSRDISKMEMWHLRIIAKNAQRYAHLDAEISDLIRASYHEAHLSYGLQYYFLGEMALARREFIQAIRHDPRHPKGYEMVLKTLLGQRVLNALRSLRNTLTRADASATGMPQR